MALVLGGTTYVAANGHHYVHEGGYGSGLGCWGMSYLKCIPFF